MTSDVKIVELRDNGTLPDGVSPPYDYFAYEQNHKDPEERELFFNFCMCPNLGRYAQSNIIVESMIWAVKKRYLFHRAY